MTKVDNKNERIKAARKKYMSNGLALALINSCRESPLLTSYWRTFRCRDIIEVSEGKTRSKLCKNRWCLSCQSVRTAQLIEGYKPALAALSQPMFVTLTAPTVPEEFLEDRILQFGNVWRKLMKRSVKLGLRLKGIRKAECTTRPNGQYHYHFHIIVDNSENADWIVTEWLRLLPSARAEGQDVRHCYGDSQLLELFKYFTKLTAKGGKSGGVEVINPKRLDVIFRALKGKRVYQPFGGISAVKEEITELDSKVVDVDDGIYEWLWCDWIDRTSGGLYSGFSPEEEDDIYNN